MVPVHNSIHDNSSLETSCKNKSCKDIEVPKMGLVIFLAFVCSSLDSVTGVSKDGISSAGMQEVFLPSVSGCQETSSISQCLKH